MILSALVDLGADFSLLERFSSVTGIEGVASVKIKRERVKKKGIMATKIDVELDEHVHSRHGHEMKEILAITSRTVEASTLP